ncbi:MULTISPECIES: hypothetical protein [Mycobacterium]|nr:MULTISPECIES: hypothetical protein [Mycobacterium]
MPKKYDEEFKARAVRLVTDHAEEYDTTPVRPASRGRKRWIWGS